MKPQLSICLVTDRRLPHFAAVEMQLFEGYEPKVGDKLFLATVPPSLREMSERATQGELKARVVTRDGDFRDAFITVPSIVQGKSLAGEYPLEWLADDSYNDSEDPWQKAHDAEFTAAAVNFVRALIAGEQPTERIELVQDGGGA